MLTYPRWCTHNQSKASVHLTYDDWKSGGPFLDLVLCAFGTQAPQRTAVVKDFKSQKSLFVSKVLLTHSARAGTELPGQAQITKFCCWKILYPQEIGPIIIFVGAKSVLVLNGCWYVRTRHNLGHLAAAIILNSRPSIFDGPPQFVITVMAALHDTQDSSSALSTSQNHPRDHKSYRQYHKNNSRDHENIGDIIKINLSIENHCWHF